MGKEKKYFRINVLPDGIWLKVKSGVSLWKALQSTDTVREGECGGIGKCGKCKIIVVTAIGPPDEEEKKLLSPKDYERGVRLACRIRVEKDLVVHQLFEDKSTDFFQILKHGHAPEIDLDPLVHKEYVTIPPPSLDNPDSDFYRIRDALGEKYKNLKITYRCLASLFRCLRRTGYSGMAIFHNECMLAWESRGSVNGRFGIAFDLGTTTLVGKLIDLNEGNEMAVISRLNSQSKYGTNVISRIQYMKEHPGIGLNRLRKLLLKDLNLIAGQLLKAISLKPSNVFVAVAAGNTTMQHILLGLDPRGIAEAPFSPVITEGMTYRTKDIGLELHPDAMMYVMPCRSGYIGGDLIGFILASGAAEDRERMILGLDIGTNGEIFLGNKNRMLTCSAAAGPALEGARISSGMIAKRGAIESVRMENDGFSYNVIGNVKPKGLCGSGLVDLAAILLHCGIIDSDGLVKPSNPVESCGLMSSRLMPNESRGTYDFLLASARSSFHDKELCLTQKDVRELQLAKGAIAAGVRILMKVMGVTEKDIDTVYLAGALGNYVNPYSAMRIGLIPRVDPDKIKSLGNAASTGAKMALLSKYRWERSTEIADFVEHVELSEHPEFFESFIEEMNFPTENLW